MMASASTSAPPIVHAIGGSLGSALALVLFYPLERARIELQAQAASVPPVSSSSPASERQIQSPEDQHVKETSLSSDEIWSSSSSSTTRRLVNAAGDESSWTSCLEEGPGDPPDQLDPNLTVVSAATISQPPSPTWSEDSTTPTEQATLRNEETTLSLISSPSQPPPLSRFSLLRCLLDLRARGMLYQGVTPIMTTIFTSQFIFFFMQAYAKKVLKATKLFNSISGAIGTTQQQQQHPALLSLLSSCIAGVGNVLLTNPLWVTNMAIVTGETRTQNLITELIQIGKDRGIAHLWDGTSASIWLVSNPIIQFFCYEQFKQARLATLLDRRDSTGAAANSKKGGGSGQPVALGALEALLIAALAKGIATITTYPLQLTQTLLRLSDGGPGAGNKKECTASDESEVGTSRHHQQQQHHYHRHYKGTMDCLIQLYKTNNKGLAAWYTGMRAKLLQTVLTAAFTFLTYEQILGAVQKIIFIRGTIAAAAAAASSGTTAMP
jgi:adenine nucleotide transporter 17